jgi:peptidoglycan-associated lipoprotein
MRIFLTSLLLLLGSVAACLAQTSKVELGLNYNWMYSNRPPGGNDTFGMNGGSVSVAWDQNRYSAFVVDIGAVHASDVPTAGQGLTVTTFLFGPRIFYRSESRATAEQWWRAIAPYGQALMGAAHATGSLSGNSGNTDTVFAMKFGGGIEVPLSTRVMLRPVQTEYLLTFFPNGVNNRQNNFLYGGGVVFRLGGR